MMKHPGYEQRTQSEDDERSRTTRERKHREKMKQQRRCHWVMM